MEFKDIRCIIAVVEHQTISHAAQSLFVSQPALSQIIRRIETELGKTLFNRRGRIMVPTSECHVIAEYGRKLLEAHDVMLYSAMHMQENVEGTLRLGMSPFYARHLLPGIIKYFLQNHPKIELQFADLGNSATQEKEVIDGNLDCCLLPMYPANPELDYLLIGEEEIYLAIPPEHPSSYLGWQEEGVDILQLRNEPFILHKDRDKVAVLQEKLFAYAGFQPREVHSVSGWDMAMAFAASGMGMTLMTELILGDYRAEELPACCHVKNIDMTRHFAMAYRRGRVLTPAMEKMYEVARMEFARQKENAAQIWLERSMQK